MTEKERLYLRDLAKKQLDYARLPQMELRKKLWYRHNALEAERPLLVMEINTFLADFLPDLACTTKTGRQIEESLLYHICNHELVDDDKVVPDQFYIPWRINKNSYGISQEKTLAKDRQGRSWGYAIEPAIKDLRQDLGLLQPSAFSVNRKATLAYFAFVNELLGDILPPVLKNNSLTWYFVPSGELVRLLGMENMLLAMYDEPDLVKQLVDFITREMLAFLNWQEEEGLLEPNSGNDYAGAGSFGFSEELAAKKAGPARSRLWGNLNSQETVGISPAMFGEFFFASYKQLAEQFGLVYYGCCEPVDQIWDQWISRLPGLRKVSVSPWCDEEFMASALEGSRVIYSRKPSPNYISNSAAFLKDDFLADIRRTLKLARHGPGLEFIFRDILTLGGDRQRPGQAVRLLRQEIERTW